jgi:large subunit ribosomal protein L21
MSAIIKVGGKQLTVKEGDHIRVEKMPNQAGESVKIETVLAVLNGDDTIFGKPFVEGASVEVKVLKHGRERKVTAFRYKPKKRVRVTRGHRQWYTELEIDKIITA